MKYKDGGLRQKLHDAIRYGPENAFDAWLPGIPYRAFLLCELSFFVR
jgi:hypothetical protein